jgi:prepilin-type N-terminal cleavage/methylation domain-containing protein
MKYFSSSRRRGFTLVELMVSITIIAILSGIIFANFQTAKQRSRDAKRVSDIANLQLAIHAFYDRCGRYPAPDSNALPDLSDGTNCPTGITFKNFISTIPVPPAGTIDTKYRYIVRNDKQDYYLGTLLENSSSSALADDVDSITTSADTGCNGTTKWCGYNDGVHGPGYFDGSDPVYAVTAQ